MGSAYLAGKTPYGDGQDTSRPVFKVISGDASAEEIAAVLTALTSAARPAPRPSAPARGTSAWADRPAMLRRPLRPGPDGWRASSRPS
jgi:hypothetical protein